jgi:hypothetical protein
MSLVGRLEDLALSDILQILSIGKKTGILAIRGDKELAFIVFRSGLVVRAETSMLENTIGHDLVAHGVVKEPILAIALDVKKKLPEKSVAEILLDLGSVSREVLDKVAKKRIERVVSRLTGLNSGDFHFELDKLDVGSHAGRMDTGWEVSKGLSAEYLLIEGARQYDEQVSNKYEEEDLSGEEGDGHWGDEDEGHGAGERKDIFALRSLTQELRFPNSTAEITLLILRFASDIFERGVLFMVGDRDLTGLGQFGLDIEQADERVREIVIPHLESPFLKKVISGGQPYQGDIEADDFTRQLLREIGDRKPPRAALFPIITENRVVALLYCDNALTDSPFAETEGLEIFIDQAGLALEKSLLQKKLLEMQKERES